MDYYSVIGRFARMMPAETAHNAAIAALKNGLVPPARKAEFPSLASEVFGLSFASPVGMAAGFDKHAEAVDALLAQGFGFVEAGTVTPLPQSGNPKPRLFRLPEDEAVINRFGFNSHGMHVFVKNLEKRRRAGIVGANIGKNKDSLDAVHDYATLLEGVYDKVDYITVNISSPNTVGLRDLQRKEALSGLVMEVENRRTKLALAHKKRKPLLYKIAPDLSDRDKEDIVEVALAHNIDGLIVTNTTVSRPLGLSSCHANETGGLSGRPLFELSTQTLRDIYRLSEGKIPLIGVGGIGSAEDAYTKIKAGASLVQLYTALVYKGFGLVREINEGVAGMLQRDGFKHIREAIGAEHR
ncbi:MAG TPA: quinone-dependent dihydroorotate dehydrogenase [Rickettsiales bacterium]|nr:quinone-dependent dihydroorotate dehydrogenase [Rickettsiales bacterium]